MAETKDSTIEQRILDGIDPEKVDQIRGILLPVADISFLPEEIQEDIINTSIDWSYGNIVKVDLESK